MEPHTTYDTVEEIARCLPWQAGRFHSHQSCCVENLILTLSGRGLSAIEKVRQKELLKAIVALPQTPQKA
eukprot:592760-Rhodomonas_salina.1